MGKKVVNRKQQRNMHDMEVLLNNNIIAQMEGPKRKKWSLHDLKKLQPLTDRQQDMFNSFQNDQHIFAYGSAGTGKTLLSLYLAMCDILNKDQPQTKLIIVRSAVQGRDSGFLPGDQDEKVAIFENPYRDMMQFLFGRPSSYDDMKAAGLITFMPTTSIRGLTWDDAYIVVDEFQNMNWMEFDSVMTRVGTNTKVMICGDIHHQCDLKKNEESASKKSINIFKQLNSFDCIQFTKDDIVRSDFVKQWIIAREGLGY